MDNSTKIAELELQLVDATTEREVGIIEKKLLILRGK